MSLLRVVRMGHPVLRQVAKPLTKEEILAPRTKELVKNMLFTMKRVGKFALITLCDFLIVVLLWQAAKSGGSSSWRVSSPALALVVRLSPRSSST